MEEDEVEEDDAAKIVNLYEETDLANKPPPNSDEESKFSPPARLVTDVNHESIPPIIQFGGNYHVGESSLTGTLLASIPKTRMAKKLKEDDLYMNRNEYDISELDEAVRKKSQWETRVRGSLPLRLRFQRTPFESTSVPRSDNSYVIARGTTIAAVEEYKDDESTAPIGTQLAEPQGSPRDPKTIAPKKASTMTQAAINHLIQERVDETIAVERERCNPISFNGNEGAMGLCRWIEKSKSVFSIGNCAKGNKVMFTVVTLQDLALTWWNNQVATMGRAVANGKS
uniref:Putative reverse transcriptase domain-containing protein n=1 Tax=Tanacetum cinerariifolium TaxID=118510 RepID=A0A699KP38_TANCI|nr:putative reverse transcriptase domain-containing protein [Tanacetum cinerariifolium]